jgi:hypothetical protein
MLVFTQGDLTFVPLGTAGTLIISRTPVECRACSTARYLFVNVGGASCCAQCAKEGSPLDLGGLEIQSPQVITICARCHVDMVSLRMCFRCCNAVCFHCSEKKSSGAVLCRVCEPMKVNHA